MPVTKCAKKLVDASEGLFDTNDANKLLKDIDKRAKAFVRNGMDYGDAVRKVSKQRFKETAKNTALEKLNQLRNLQKVAEITTRIQDRIADGHRVDKAFQAETVGIESYMEGSRNSVDALQDAILGGYAGTFFHGLESQGLTKILRSGEFTREIARDLWALSRGEKPPTKNTDINKVAQVIYDTQKKMTDRMNRAGADIQDVGGFIMSQAHDQDKMMKAGKDVWVTSIKPRLDIEKSFGGMVTPEDIDDALERAYEALVTGVRFMEPDPKDAKMFQFSGPANLAKRLSQHRRLIFRSSDEFLNYNEEFGRNNFNEAIETGIREGSRDIALLERFGTNPEYMLRKIWDETKQTNRKILSEGGQKPKETFIESTINEVTGKADHSANPTLSRMTTNLKTWNSVTYLGGVTLAAVGDTAFKSLEYRYQGRSLLSSIGRSLADIGQMFKSREEQVKFSSMVGVYAENWIGDISSKIGSGNNFTSNFTKTQRGFFRAVGLFDWDKNNKLSMARAMSHELGLLAKTNFNDLPVDTKRNLGLYDIGESDWDTIRKNVATLEDGRDYITAEGLVDNLGDKMRMYFIDRVNHGVITSTGSTRARMNLGTQRGTWSGEALRLIMQFKSWPTAMFEKAWGRAIYGKDTGADYQAMVELIVLGTIMGYTAMTLKDFVKGKEPRDPFDPRTVMAAFVQGGGGGIYGDLLFSDSTGYGRSLIDLLAGPTASRISGIHKLYRGIIEGHDPSAQAFYQALSAVPGQNIFYLREPLNHLILYRVQEYLNPGSINRMVKRSERERNQKYIWEPDV